MSGKHMTAISRYYFGSELDNPLLYLYHQEYERRIGAFVWYCSVILAEYVWQQRFHFSGANVVELGAGISLPGLVAAKVGSRVTLTNDSDRSEVLEKMK